MSHPTLFDFLAVEFNEAKIPFLLIGGFAVNYYQASRFTGDVDILIDERNYQKVLPILEQAGYEQIAKQHLFARFKGKKDDLMDLDIMFVDEKTFSGMLKTGQKAKIENGEFIIPSLDHLMALKLHSLKNNPNRENPDMIDLINLIQINHVDIMKDDFRNLCLTYGTKELYDRLSRIVTAWTKS